MKAERIELEPRTMLGVHDVIPMNEMTAYFERAFMASAAEIGKQGAYPAGPPIALYHGAPVDNAADITAGFPVAQPVTPGEGTVVVTLPGGPAIETIHTGSYDDLGRTYAEVTDWITAEKLATAGDMWEEYLVGPDSETDPAKWQTRIVFPLA